MLSLSSLGGVPHTLLPILPSLIGLGAFTAGIYSLLNPQSASRLYGLPSSLPRHTNTSASFPDILTILDSPNKKQTSTNESKSQTSSAPPSRTIQSQINHSSLHFPLAIRNISTSLTILLLTAYWHNTRSDPNIASVVSDTLQNIIGLVILVGSFVPLTDAWICWRARAESGSGERAACLHVGRLIAWVGTGLCLVRVGGTAS